MNTILLLLLTVLSLTFVRGDYFNDTATVFPRLNGWYQGRATYFYNFGPRSPVINQSIMNANVLIFVYSINNGVPNLVTEQNNIFPLIPDDAGYTDLWQIYYVTVPTSYTANSIRDYQTASTLFHNMTAGPIVNYPLVPLNSILAGGELNVISGWYQNQTINYFNFGSTSSLSVPLWVLLSNKTTVQNDIFDTIPGNANYSQFHNVTYANISNSNIALNSIRSTQSLLTIDFSTINGVTLNTPIVSVDATITPYVSSSIATVVAQWTSSIIRTSSVISVEQRTSSVGSTQQKNSLKFNTHVTTQNDGFRTTVNIFLSSMMVLFVCSYQFN